MKTLIIVESPAKARTIQKILGSDFIVKSSFGHVRDLEKKNMGIDVNNNFKPKYVTLSTRYKQITEIKSAYKDCNDIILASDEDREGEAIAWHLATVLKINNPKRIVFHEITATAIKNALQNIGTINMGMVNAQQGRRILDRLVGFEISPLLWKYIKTSLSAGRVQSLVTRIIIDRENEIEKFERESYYKVTSLFMNKLCGELDKNFRKRDECLTFLNDCKSAKFTIIDIQKKKVKRYPAAPFITSTLQQEAGKKLNMSSKMIMDIAQKLYENGFITYHRTDSTNLSDDIIGQISNFVIQNFGKEYLNIRKYKTKTKSAQEAHEAIRPTSINRISLDNTDGIIPQMKKLYQMIWKRTVASQMAPTEVEIYQIKINISNRPEQFIAKAEKIIFPGFRKVYDYKEANEDDDKNGKEIGTNQLKIIESLKLGMLLEYQNIICTEKFTNPIGRYSEPTLIKKMENLGIGRPSTYASIISIIQEREYVVKETRKGKKVDFLIIKLEKEKEYIKEEKGETILETERNKLFPTDIGHATNKFLLENFENIMDYQFTSRVEEELDEIANGKKVWSDVVARFYKTFHPQVDKMNAEANKGQNGKNKRLVGKERGTDKNIYAYIGKFGPVLQIGEGNKDGDVKYVGLKKDQSIDKITEEEANVLLKYPRKMGMYEDKEILLREGRYGLYLEYNGKNYGFEKDMGEDITLKQAKECIEKRDKKIIKEIGKTIKIMNGEYGPFILMNKKIIAIPKNMDPKELTAKDCKELAEKKTKNTFKKREESVNKEETRPNIKAVVKKRPIRKNEVKK